MSRTGQVKDLHRFRNHCAKLIYFLREEYDLSYQKIGDVLGITKEGVSNFMRRNREGLEEEVIITKFRKDQARQIE